MSFSGMTFQEVFLHAKTFPHPNSIRNTLSFLEQYPKHVVDGSHTFARRLASLLLAASCKKLNQTFPIYWLIRQTIYCVQFQWEARGKLTVWHQRPFRNTIAFKDNVHVKDTKTFQGTCLVEIILPNQFCRQMYFFFEHPFKLSISLIFHLPSHRFYILFCPMLFV